MKLIILIVVVTLLGCDAQTVKPDYATPAPAPTLTPTDYESMCIVGNQYTLCPPKDADPFAGAGNAVVTIVDKKHGYVQYAYTHDLSRKSFTRFSRSYEEFIRLTNNCK